MNRLRQLWSRYQLWRHTPGKRKPELSKPTLKVDASDSDLASHTTSNPGGGWGTM